MDADRLQFVLPGQHEGEVAIADQRQSFAIDAVDGVERIEVGHLLASVGLEG